MRTNKAIQGCFMGRGLARFLSSLPLLVTTTITLISFVQVVTAANDDDHYQHKEYFGGTDHNDSYLRWIQDEEIDSRYPSSIFMPSSTSALHGAALHWHVSNDGILSIALAARRPVTATSDDNVWLAFGISQVGGMLGSDVVYWEAAEPDALTDAHIVETRKPVRDCNQDWKLLAVHDAKSNDYDDFIMWQGSRPLNTGDEAHDFAIVTTKDESDVTVPPHRVIAAWGTGDRIGYHGRDGVARGAVRFFPNTLTNSQIEGGQGGEGSTASTTITSKSLDPNQLSNIALGSFFVGANNHTVQPIETDYVDFCFTKNDLIAQGVPDTALHVVAFQPYVTPEAAKYVHHFVVTATTDPSATVCESENEGFMEMAYVWAPGVDTLVLPDTLGGPLLGSSGFSAFSIEIHYNNPDFDVGIMDSSGVHLYYTDQLREFEVGILQVGDPFIGLYGQPVGQGLSRHTFDCPGTCSDLVLGSDGPVTVIREYLHMHKAGARMENEQYRNGEKIRGSSIEVWEFDQQGNPPIVQEPFEIAPGDSFRTTCYYRDDKLTVFGLGSQEEMCIAFMYYYPRKMFLGQFPWVCPVAEGGDDDDNKDFLACSGTYNMSRLATDAELNRTFGSVPDLDCTNDASAGSSSEGYPLALAIFLVAGVALFNTITPVG